MRVFDILKEVIKELKLNTDFRPLYKEYNKIFLAIVKEKLDPMPGLLESIDLFKRNHFKLAIASSGIKKYIKLVLTKLNLFNTFDVIISGDDVKIGKPHPEVYLTACNKLGISPEKCLVLEDAETGIEAAKRAGCKCIAIKNSNTPPQNFSKADFVLNSLKDLTLDVVNSM